MKINMRAIYKDDPAKVFFFTRIIDDRTVFVAENDPECRYEIGDILNDPDWIIDVWIEEAPGVSKKEYDKIPFLGRR